MARDEYTFTQLAKYEVKGPGITLSSPENAALLKRLQNHWEKKEKYDPKANRENFEANKNRAVILINKYGIKTKFKSINELASELGYENAKSVVTCVKNGLKLRGGNYAMWADEVDA